MGCLFKCLDPGPPDDSVRHFWHIRGLLLDALPCSSNNENTNSQQQQQQKQSKPDNLCVQESGSSSGGGGGRTTKNDEENGGGGLIPKLTVQRLPPGVLYVYEGRLVYRSRRWMPWPSNIFLLSSSSGRRQPGEFSIELCQIGDVNVVEQFISQRDGKPFRCQGPLVDVVVTGKQPNIHLGLLTAQPDCVGKELREVFLRHRQRPRIFQFNSVDIDGVEIEVP
ncbi:unnamed protein product [Meloidogyne enterolobii]|uniref:Uncharacterized protein n=2 Tax=Meloidogyne enterolobii TaxID=390850 RepID=A0A6V7XPW7_MELEN|nr:unnamed protein product [Meloidogyne enterolobii]